MGAIFHYCRTENRQPAENKTASPQTPKPMHLTGTNIEPTHSLAPILQRWSEFMEDSTWGNDDCPWWYNERASISQLAGAIWDRGGWAFEEFSDTKRTPEALSFQGRVDLMFWTSRERNGPQYIAEAKLCWPKLRSARLQETVESAFRSATLDTQKITSHRGRYEKLALVFIAPVIPLKFSTLTNPKIHALIETMKRRPDTHAAWHFRLHQNIPKHNNYLYPGVILGVHPVAHR